MSRAMTGPEAEIAEKVLRTLTERDPFEDGEVEMTFSGASPPGPLRAPASCSARVLSDDAELRGLYEVTVSVRRLA